MSAFGLAVTAGIDFRETASESIIRLEVVWKRSDHVNAKVSINLRRIRGIGHEVIICDIVVSTWDSISCVLRTFSAEPVNRATQAITANAVSNTSTATCTNGFRLRHIARAINLST
ncbi:hypothetical protein ACHAXN_003699 [Cyclotella atomus]